MRVGVSKSAPTFVMNPVTTQRLVLQLYTPAEREDFLGLLTDARVMKHVDRGVMSREAAERLWDRLLNARYPAGDTSIWAVFADGDRRRYIGHASVRPRPSIPTDWEIGYYLKPEEWGKGFATEIARRLVSYSFETIGLDEVFATVDTDHAASIRVLEKAGFRYLREEFDEDGGFSVYCHRRSEHLPR